MAEIVGAAALAAASHAGTSTIKVIANLLLDKYDGTIHDLYGAQETNIDESQRFDSAALEGQDFARQLLRSLAGRGVDGTHLATEGHLSGLRMQLSDQIEAEFNSVRDALTNLRSSLQSSKREQLSNALRCFTRYKRGKEKEQLERAARGSGKAMTACETLEENFLAARLHVATEYVLVVEGGPGNREAEAKAHLVGTIFPTIVEDVLVRWQRRDNRDPSYSRIFIVMLEIVSSIDALPPQQESFIGQMYDTSPKNNAVRNFARDLAQFCGLNPRIGTEFAGVTKKLISAQCQFYSDGQIRELYRWARLEQNLASLREIEEARRRSGDSFSGRVSIDPGSNRDHVRGTREELIKCLCSMETILDFKRLDQELGTPTSPSSSEQRESPEPSPPQPPLPRPPPQPTSKRSCFSCLQNLFWEAHLT